MHNLIITLAAVAYDNALLEAYFTTEQEEFSCLDLEFDKGPEDVIWEVPVDCDTLDDIRARLEPLLTENLKPWARRYSDTQLENQDDYYARNGNRPWIFDWDHAWTAFHLDPSLADIYPEFPNNLPERYRRTRDLSRRHQSVQSQAELRVSSNEHTAAS